VRAGDGGSGVGGVVYLYLLVLGLKILDLGTLLYSQEFGEEEEEEERIIQRECDD
jgi:hypothetical protein